MSSRKRKKQRRTEVNNPQTVQHKQVKVKPKTRNQRLMLKSIYTNDMTFVIGAAGSGKTHISVGAAVDLLQRKKIDKIIITRPIVEAGQKDHGNKSRLGYLPGDIDSKMSPFVRPINDELGKFLSKEAIRILREEEILEICPIEHMRGRTFENAFIICDEAQNATEDELEMLFTRLGNGSKMVVVGDIDQTDLTYHLQGGFENMVDDLDGLPGLGIIYLETCDIARHPLVAAIIERRKQVKAQLNGPISMERMNYDGKSERIRSENPSSECEYDANPSNPLDGCIQENL